MTLLETDESAQVFYQHETPGEFANSSQQKDQEAFCASAPPMFDEENLDRVSSEISEDSHPSLQYIVQPFTESQV